MPCYYNLSDVFLMIILQLWVFGRSQKCHFPLRVHTIKMIHDCWCWPWSSGWSSASQISPLWLSVIYLESFFMWDCFFSPFINLFSHLFILVWTHGYYSLDYNPILLNVFSCSDYPNVGHWEIFQWAPVPFWYASISVCVCLLALPYFMTLQDAPGSSWIFPVSVLESAIWHSSLTAMALGQSYEERIYVREKSRKGHHRNQTIRDVGQSQELNVIPSVIKCHWL